MVHVGEVIIPSAPIAVPRGITAGSEGFFAFGTVQHIFPVPSFLKGLGCYRGITKHVVPAGCLELK